MTLPPAACVSCHYAATLSGGPLKAPRVLDARLLDQNKETNDSHSAAMARDPMLIPGFANWTCSRNILIG